MNPLGSKTAAILLIPLLGSLPLVGQIVNGLRFQLTFVFPPTVLACYFIAVNTLPLGRALLPEQKPVGLEKLDLFNNLLRGHLPAIIFGVAAGTFMLGGKIFVDSVNDCFVVFAILVLVSFLTKLSPLSQYFLSTLPTQTPDQDCSRSESKELHGCFKLLVRDFAGQMEYHCMHQPFLPKYGVFVCVFSWKRAGEISLKYAEHRNAPADGRPVRFTNFWILDSFEFTKQKLRFDSFRFFSTIKNHATRFNSIIYSDQKSRFNSGFIRYQVG